jgi:formate dehydrogenase beta subunit
VTVFDAEAKAGGFIRTQIPRFRLPESVIDEETGYMLDLGVEFRGGERIDSMKALMAQDWDAIFVGCGAPRGRDLDAAGPPAKRRGRSTSASTGSSVSFGHVSSIGRRVIVLGGGNTAMDCCRSARRLGGTDVKVIVRSGFAEMKASPWEKEDAQHEGIRSSTSTCPRPSCTKAASWWACASSVVAPSTTRRAAARWCPPASRRLTSNATRCWWPWARKTPSRGSSATAASPSTSGACPVDASTFQSTVPNVFFGGDAAFGPKNIITAVAHGHEAAVSIDKLLRGEAGAPCARRP